MKTTAYLAAILPWVVSSATAQDVSCQTSLGPKSIKIVPTSTITSTNVMFVTQSLVKQSTITILSGYASTATLFRTTTTTTTMPAKTDTATITTISFDVQTLTATSTTTTTTTQTDTTSSTSTTITPTASGFRNVWDTLNSNSLSRRKVPGNPHAGVQARAAVSSGQQGIQKLLATQYPNKVMCTKVIPRTSTKTAYTTLPKSTKTIPILTKKVTTLATLTQTSTIFPPAVTSTKTETSTSAVQTTTTSTQTDTSTSTTTTTSILPGPTFYAACSNPSGLNTRNIFGPGFKSNNIAYYAVNVANNGPGVSSDFQIVADGADSAEACCNACQQLYNCETYIFRQQFRNCFLLNHQSSTCSSQSQHPNFILSKKVPASGMPADGYVVGNGNCGYTWSGNSDGSVFRVDGA